MGHELARLGEISVKWGNNFPYEGFLPPDQDFLANFDL